MTTAALEPARLRREQTTEAAGVLARAFFDYPMWTWLVPDEAHRRELMPWFMAMSVRYGFLAGETYIVGEPLAGIAIWERPVEQPVDVDPDGTKSGYSEMPQRMGADAMARFDAMVEVQRPVRLECSKGSPFWYLPWLGVEPAAQRSGIGTALLQAMFARADASKTPIVLETEKKANVPYYERHGFRVVASGILPLGGPSFWTMMREPA